MVYFEQHVVLPPETRDRLDRLLDLLSAYHHKLPAHYRQLRADLSPHRCLQLLYARAADCRAFPDSLGPGFERVRTECGVHGLE
jgi:hypothetical protein